MKNDRNQAARDQENSAMNFNQSPIGEITPVYMSLARFSVLVVENGDLASMLERSLSPMTVMHADSVPEAMESILFFRPEIIVLAGPRQQALLAALHEDVEGRSYITHERLSSLGGEVAGIRWLLHRDLDRRSA
jgi:hypothetical protein